MAQQNNVSGNDRPSGAGSPMGVDLGRVEAAVRAANPSLGDRPVEFVLSARRRKSIQVKVRDEALVVMAPALITEKELTEIAKQLVGKVLAKFSPDRGGDYLLRRAHFLNERYLDSRATVAEVVWVTNMDQRWGSCSRGSKKIRISHRLQQVPEYVLDKVLVHELVHTFIFNHGPDFRAWEARAPHNERADGYLEAYARWGS